LLGLYGLTRLCLLTRIGARVATRSSPLIRCLVRAGRRVLDCQMQRVMARGRWCRSSRRRRAFWHGVAGGMRRVTSRVGMALSTTSTSTLGHSEISRQSQCRSCGNNKKQSHGVSLVDSGKVAKRSTVIPPGSDS
jgi:hypothetical protein